MGRARAYAYTAVTTAIVLLFALAEWATERYLSDVSRAASIVVEVGILFCATLAFRPVHRRVEQAVDAAFTKRKREALAALSRFRRELPSFSDLPQLLRRVLEAVERHADARACAVYLRREVFRAEASSFETAAADIDARDPLIVRLRSSSVPAQPALLKSSARGTHAFPMTIRGDLIGFMLVQCPRPYDEDETQMLTGLAQDAAAAAAAFDPQLRPQPALVPNNIPADLPAIVGREQELREIQAALSQSRLVTIVGTGGVGKTCIALQCAMREMRAHEHGAWLVNLSPITDGALVEATLCAVLGAGDMLEHLRERDLLLVLDNCEQVVTDVARIVAQIGALCPRVTVLATSRELLHVNGEQVYRLRPLRWEAATELFAMRAKSTMPSFDAAAHAQAVRSICEQLDGIPLAIELAAARVRALAPEEIVAHLGEHFRILKTGSPAASPRHQTLAATIGWSYDLLTPDEQSLFVRLAVFRGTFSLPAALAVCTRDGSCDEYHVLDVLTSLADKSLLVVRLGATTRYRMLETLREFAEGKAAEQHAQPTAQNAHAGFFAGVAAQAYHEFDSRLPPGWLDRLAPDLDNFRAALHWTLEGAGDRFTGAQLAADCGPMFLRMTLLDEGLRWCGAALSVAGVPSGTAARLQYVASMMHNNLGQYKRALHCTESAVELYRACGDERGLVRALSQLANQYARAHRFEDAREPARQALDRARALGEPRVLVGVLRRCALALPAGEIGQARQLFAEAIEIARAAQDPEEVCMLLDWWASCEAASGALERAIEIAMQGLVDAQASSRIALEIKITGWMLALNRFEPARPHAAAALELSARVSSPLARALALAYWAGLCVTDNAGGAAALFGHAKARLDALEWRAEPDDELALNNVYARIERTVESSALRDSIARGAMFSEEQVLSLCAASQQAAG